MGQYTGTIKHKSETKLVMIGHRLVTDWIRTGATDTNPPSDCVVVRRESVWPFHKHTQITITSQKTSVSRQHNTGTLTPTPQKSTSSASKLRIMEQNHVVFLNAL